MLRRFLCRALARPALVGLGGLALTVGTTVGPFTAGTFTAQADPVAGPPYQFTTFINYGGVIPLSHAGKLNRTEHGYLYRAGQQDTRLTMTLVKGGLRFADTGMSRWDGQLPGACSRRDVTVGIAAVCKVPADVTTSRPLLIEVWPRLGDDFVDSSRLPATFAVAMLGDKGEDTARFGAGPDFFNGAQDDDEVWGGAGNDWLRTNDGRDVIHGGPGDDVLAGVDGNDVVYGDEGQDQVGGGSGNDTLYSGPGRDSIICSTGWDVAYLDHEDVGAGSACEDKRYG